MFSGDAYIVVDFYPTHCNGEPKPNALHFFNSERSVLVVLNVNTFSDGKSMIQKFRVALSQTGNHDGT